MKPDTITVRILTESELDADSADLTVIVEGSSVFSGAEAVKKAKELRALIDSLKEAGLDESRVKLRSVEINSQSFALIKTSSAKYVVSVKTVAIEMLPAVLGAVASHKGVHLSRLKWNYSGLKETRSRLREEALADALGQAQRDAEVLGVRVLGVHQIMEQAQGRDYNPEYIAGDSADFLGMRAGGKPQPIGLQLGNSTTVSLDIRAEFRVSPIGQIHQGEEPDRNAPGDSA
ncbi:MAG: SIMPL domain-containing protein [Planctomycetota bacterium]